MTQPQTPNVVASDDEDDEYIVPDHLLEASGDVADVDVSDVTNMDDLQTGDGQDTGDAPDDDGGDQ